MDLADRREQYETTGLGLADLAPDPVDQFAGWYRAAEDAGLWEPNAFVISAVDAEGWAASRYVLLKGFGPDGFVFYTNYGSAKAAALEATGRACLTFGWLSLRRQVRVHGTVERTTREESEAYFARRPRSHQLGAWASPQSEVVADRDELERRWAEAEARFAGEAIPPPPHWGGYRVRHSLVEFWQGRPNRFHDRLRYRRSGDGWIIERLAP